MSHLWQRENPAFYEREKAAVETHYPDLRFVEAGDIVCVRGTFPLLFEGQVLDRYSVELELARDHPNGLPVVREVGGRIPRHADRHINAQDGTACAWLPDERWRVWPKGAPLLDFLKGPLHGFFLAQSLVEAGQPWPWGQWAHGAKGVFQFYREILKTADLRVMITFLEYIAAKKPKGYWACACESGKPLRKCHFVLVSSLREKISRKDALRSLNALKTAGVSAVEMTEAKPAPASK
jgi:hypothetical protein